MAIALALAVQLKRWLERLRKKNRRSILLLPLAIKNCVVFDTVFFDCCLLFRLMRLVLAGSDTARCVKPPTPQVYNY